MKMNQSAVNSFSIVLLCLTAFGCTSSTVPESIGNPLLNNSLYFVQPGGYISADDTVNTRAIVWMKQDYYERIDPISGDQLPVIIQHAANASFHPMISASEPLADIVVNDSVVRPDNYWSVGRNAPGFLTHFESGASSNSLRKQGDRFLGAIDTNVLFGEAVRITNIKAGDTIDISNERAFTYSGPSGNMKISVYAITEPGEGELTSAGRSFYGIEGMPVSITFNGVERPINSKGMIEVTRFDMRFLVTSSRAKIAFIGETTHHLPVHLVRRDD